MPNQPAFSRIPLINLQQQHAPLHDEILRAWQTILHSTQFVNATEVASFEVAFSNACETQHCIAVSNGTDALILALHALGVQAGDRIAVPANSFIATAEAVSLVGAIPVFIDVNQYTRNICSTSLETALSKGTIKGVIAVHLYGHPAEILALKQLTSTYDIWLLEDCAQAHLARYQGVPVGSFGDIAAFSFYPTKNLGSTGEGGAVTTNSDVLADKVRLLRNHGQQVANRHECVGYNARLGELEAAALRIKLRYLPAWNVARRRVAELYTARLDNNPDIQLPVVEDWAEPVWHLYVIQVSNRDRIRELLADVGVATGVHYPVPIHLQSAYHELGYQAGMLPIAEKSASEVISLPMFPELSETDVDFVCDSLERSIRKAKKESQC